MILVRTEIQYDRSTLCSAANFYAATGLQLRKEIIFKFNLESFT